MKYKQKSQPSGWDFCLCSMQHPFRQFIENYTFFSNQDWQLVEVCLQKKMYSKDVLLVEDGKICKTLYFLESGLLRFFIVKDGNDITKFFTEAPYCFTSQRSFTTQKPANENIETLEDCIIWEMSHYDAFRLLENPSWSEFVRKLVQEVQGFTEEILEEIQTETAENRYRKMLETANPLLQRVPLKHLASYFGIAPQSLSRIRKQIFETSRT
jgi:CRP/FNR family transcriptional regulator, anaerobic regulatory protein